MRAADLPVTRLLDLLVEYPLGRGGEGFVVGCQAGVLKRGHGQHGVPDRGLARLEAAHAVLADREAVKAVDGLLDDRVVQAVAHQVQCHDRVHPRRLNAAPAAVGLLAGDDPVDAPAPGGAPGIAWQPRLDLVQRLVQGVERDRPGVVLLCLGVLAWDLGVQFVDLERQRVARLEGGDDREGDDRLPGPAAPVVNVQREPRRQVDDLRRDHRQVIPRPQPGKRQPDPGEYPRRADAALGGDPGGGALHVLRVRVVAPQLERDVGLDRGGEVARAAVEVGPGAVLALLRADPDGCLRGVRLGEDAEEVPEQDVLGVHGHVGL